jgi:hypothetical protein
MPVWVSRTSGWPPAWANNDDANKVDTTVIESLTAFCLKIMASPMCAVGRGVAAHFSLKNALPYRRGKLYVIYLDHCHPGKTMKSSQVLLAAAALLFATSFSNAFAQGAAASDSMAGMDMSAHAQTESNSPSTAALQSADHSMMTRMSSVGYTGDTDHDFVAHMIPHHEGAVAMAKVELKYGKDAKLRALAKEIITSQDKEIAFMKQWLAAHPQKN